MAIPLLERYFTWRQLGKRIGRHNEFAFLDLLANTVSHGPRHTRGDDFHGDTLDALYQSTASGANSVAAAISTGVVNGAILLDAGDANAGRSDLSWGLHYQAQLNAIYIARFSINTLTTRKFEIGFTNVISGTDAGAVNVKATPTFRAANCCCLVYDTDDDNNLTLVGNKATVAATVADFSIVLSAATYYYFGVALNGDSDSATGFVLNADGALLEEKTITAPITVTTLLTPWLFVQNRAGNAGNMTVDWHDAYQRRTTAT